MGRRRALWRRVAQKKKPRRAAAMRGGVGRYDGEREDAFSDSLFKKIKSTAGLCFTLAGL